jgi:hypothetical protein
MWHTPQPKAAERRVKPQTLGRRAQKAAQKPVSKPVRASYLGKLDKGLKNY